MLRRYHGVQALRRIKRRRLLQGTITAMASFSGTSTLATDAMRALGAFVRNPSSVGRTPPHSTYRVWKPQNGIVFGNDRVSTAQTSPRLASLMSTNAIDGELSRHSEIEDSYVLANSLREDRPNNQATKASILKHGKSKGEAPDQQAMSESIIGSGGEDEGSIYAPSATTGSAEASQESILHDEVVEEPIEEEPLEEEPTEEEENEEFKNENGKAAHTPLSFQILDKVLAKAKEAAPGTKESYWSHKLYLGPDDQEVRVHYCKSKHTTERVAQYFANEKVLGFDIEWKPEANKNSGIKKNVALIQIASEERIALFHIALYPGDTAEALVAPTLRLIMEDPEITKVGVAIKADCTRLRNYLHIDPKGILELSHLFKLVKHSTLGDTEKINKKLVSLATQVEEHLPLPIFKGEVRGSDWSQPLSMDQILYAAADAYCNLMLYDRMEYKRKQLDPTPPRPYHAELNLPIRLVTGAEIPTADEAVIEEPEAPEATARKSSVAAESHPASELEAAAENVQIESEEDSDFTYSPFPKSRAKPTPKPKESKLQNEAKEVITQPPKSQIILDAELWALSHRKAHPADKNSRMPAPTFAALRTYALWHANPDMSLAAIAAELRTPPLKSSTVANYILEAVRMEKVPFQQERLREIFAAWPEGGKLWRYKALREGIGLGE